MRIFQMTNRTFKDIVKTDCMFLVFTILQSNIQTLNNERNIIVKTKIGAL